MDDSGNVFTNPVRDRMKRKPIIIVLIVALCLACAATQFWKPLPLDLSNDEEPFRSMDLPPKAVIGAGYMDGGSVAVHVIDRTGARYEFTFPIDYGKIGNPYPTAYYGNMNDPKMVPLKDPERAKQIAIRLLKDHGIKVSHPSVSDDYDGTKNAIRALSNPTYIKAFRAVDKVRDIFQ